MRKLKKASVFLLILAIAAAPLFRGLFFKTETCAFFGVIAFICCLYYFAKLIKRETLRINSLITVIGVGIIASYGISSINALNPRENLELILQYASFLNIFIVLYDHFYGNKDGFVKLLFLPVMISGFVCALIGLVKMPGILGFLNDIVYIDRIGSTFQYVNTASAYYAVCFVFALTMINSAGSALLKIVLSGIGTTLILAYLYTKSLGGFLAGAIGILIFLALQPKGYRMQGVLTAICMALPAALVYKSYSEAFINQNYVGCSKWLAISFLVSMGLAAVVFLISKIKLSRKAKIISFSTSAAAILVCVVLLFASYGQRIGSSINVINELSQMNLNTQSVNSRVEFFRDAIKLIEKNWLAGIGGGGWTASYQSVQESFYVARDVHNQYLQIFVEGGILGFLLFAALVVISAVNLIISYVKNRDSRSRVFISGLFGGFLLLSFHIGMDFDFSYISIVLMFWAMISGTAIYIPKSDDEKTTAGIKTNRLSFIAGAVLLIVCISLTFVRGMHVIASVNADKGYKAMEDKRYMEAASSYEAAVKFDPINSEYYSQLALVYNYFMLESKSYDDFQGYSQKALKAAKKSVVLNRCYPANLEILTRVNFDAGVPLESLESAQKLVKYQPLNTGNYELLARSYLEAATYYMTLNNRTSALKLVTACSQLDSNPKVLVTPAIKFYKAKSLIILNRFQDAEKLLLAVGKSSQKYKLHSEILLYFIYESQGIEAGKKNAYKDLEVESIKESELYAEMKLYADASASVD